MFNSNLTWWTQCTSALLLATSSSPMRLVDSLPRTQCTSVLPLATLPSFSTRLLFSFTVKSCGLLINNHLKSFITSFLLALTISSTNRSTLLFLAGTMFCFCTQHSDRPHDRRERYILHNCNGATLRSIILVGLNKYTSYITLHYITLHYITLHYITLHYITLHYITLHYITLHYITLHYIPRFSPLVATVLIAAPKSSPLIVL